MKIELIEKIEITDLKKEKYMIQAVNEVSDNCNTFIHDCLEDVEGIGRDFHAEAEKMTLDEAFKGLDATCAYFKQCYQAGEGKTMETTAIMDIVIAAGIVFKKLTDK